MQQYSYLRPNKINEFAGQKLLTFERNCAARCALLRLQDQFFYQIREIKFFKLVLINSFALLASRTDLD